MLSVDTAIIVTSLSQIPFPVSSIVGLQGILPAATTLSQLVAQNRLFIEDFTVFGFNASDAAANSVIEAPIILYYVDQTPRLMPLAIRFTINNQLTYSPADPAADWEFAKIVVNAIDSAVTGSSKSNFLLSLLL